VVFFLGFFVFIFITYCDLFEWSTNAAIFGLHTLFKGVAEVATRSTPLNLQYQRGSCAPPSWVWYTYQVRTRVRTRTVVLLLEVS
jgi:hypothetical protein